MTRLSLRLLPLVLLGLPLAGHAATVVAQCGLTHFVRNGGTEMASTAITVRNADPVYTATIARLTIRDGLGNVVHDSGTSTPLPLNTDFPNTFPGGRDITQIPPGGSAYLRSNHIWGNNGLPSGAAGNEVGQSLSATLVITKDGPRNHLAVAVTPRIRERVLDPVTSSYRETTTRSSGNSLCDLSAN